MSIHCLKKGEVGFPLPKPFQAFPSLLDSNLCREWPRPTSPASSSAVPQSLLSSSQLPCTCSSLFFFQCVSSPSLLVQLLFILRSHFSGRFPWGPILLNVPPSEFSQLPMLVLQSTYSELNYGDRCGHLKHVRVSHESASPWWQPPHLFCFQLCPHCLLSQSRFSIDIRHMSE